MTAQHQCLDRQQERLDAQQKCMHEAGGIDDMQRDTFERAGLRIIDHIMVAGIGIDDAATARRNPLETILVERLQEDEN